MAKSISGGVEVINTLSTKNNGNYPLVMAESVELADGKTVEEAVSKASQDISTKLNKNQGTEHSGKLIGVDETGNAVPTLAKGVTYRPDVNCLEFGSAHNLPLLKGIILDETLTKLGYAADSKTVGTKIDLVNSGIAALQAEDKTIKENATKHNSDVTAHNDIRILIKNLSDRLAALANSDDQTLDQMAEVVAYIKNNKSLIDGITTSKVNVTDIVNNLTSNVTDRPLSAAQGVELKRLIDASPKNKSDIGLSNVTNDKQIKGLANGVTVDHVITFGADGYTVKDSGFTIASDVPANAKFTDTIYTHPEKHLATMITEDSTHRFVADADKTNWNGKLNKNVGVENKDKIMAVNAQGDIVPTANKTLSYNNSSNCLEYK